MKQVNIHEAKTHFSKLVKAASEGKTTIIARSGKPVAKLVPIKEGQPKRRLGGLKGKAKIPEDLEAFEIPKDMIEAMYGGKLRDPRHNNAA